MKQDQAAWRRSDWRTRLGAVLLIAAATSDVTADAIGRDATVTEAEAVTRHLAALGYTAITDIDVVDGRFVVDAKSPAGVDVDVTLDQRSLALVAEQPS